MNATERFLSKVDQSGDCWPWTGARYPNGYGAFRLGGRQTTASRASYQLFVGEIPAGYVICHKCDNPVCVRPNHLFAGTQKQNMADMDAKGRRRNGQRNQAGELNNNAKFTWGLAREIRKLYGEGMPQAAISRHLGVSRLNVWNVVHNKSWVED